MDRNSLLKDQLELLQATDRYVNGLASIYRRTSTDNHIDYLLMQKTIIKKKDGSTILLDPSLNGLKFYRFAKVLSIQDEFEIIDQKYPKVEAPKAAQIKKKNGAKKQDSQGD